MSTMSSPAQEGRGFDITIILESSELLWFCGPCFGNDYFSIVHCSMIKISLSNKLYVLNFYFGNI